jgi:carboxyl-terminal processing protease
LGRENERRKLRGLPPVAKLADLTGQDPPDAVLDETVEIAADLSGMSNLYLSRLKAQGDRDATP